MQPLYTHSYAAPEVLRAQPATKHSGMCEHDTHTIMNTCMCEHDTHPIIIKKHCVPVCTVYCFLCTTQQTWDCAYCMHTYTAHATLPTHTPWNRCVFICHVYVFHVDAAATISWADWSQPGECWVALAGTWKILDCCFLYDVYLEWCVWCVWLSTCMISASNLSSQFLC